MFDLEQAIAGWRERMAADGIKASATLDELENHLRDEFQQQINSGCDKRKAFEIAIHKIGEVGVLKAEFMKVGEPVVKAGRRKLFGKILIAGTIVASAFLQIFSDSFVSVHRHGMHGAIIIHWTVFLMMTLNFAGFACLIWPARRRPHKVD